MKEGHTVKVQLKGHVSKDNRIWIDDKEILNVTSFGLEAGISKAGTVIIAFIADVEGEFEGAANLLEDRTSELPQARAIE